MVLTCRACNAGKADDAPTRKEIKRFINVYNGTNLPSFFGKGAII